MSRVIRDAEASRDEGDLVVSLWLAPSEEGDKAVPSTSLVFRGLRETPLPVLISSRALLIRVDVVVLGPFGPGFNGVFAYEHSNCALTHLQCLRV